MKEKEKNPRLGKVGGQAVLEGVMMKAGSDCATACRRECGDIVVLPQKFVSIREKHRILRLPLLRGVVNFIEMLKLSMSTLTASAEIVAGGEELEESKFESWVRRHFGIKLFDVLMVIAAILGVALAVGLFMILPSAAADLIDNLTFGDLGVWRSVIEGGLKIVIFILYLLLVSLMGDIRRTFEYHGAEHKSIACYESGEELTPANAKRHTRFHPRCGTSFMFVMILIGIFVGFLIRYLIPHLETWQYVLIRLLILPLVVGIGYEFIMFAGKHNNIVTRVLSTPGLWMQRITTREPSEEQLEVAICALKYALVEAFPDFDREAVTYRPEEKSAEAEDTKVENEESAEDAALSLPSDDGEQETDHEALGSN